MAVALEELYQEIEPLYDIRLVTDSCFHKIIEWTHIVENPEFIKLLHGNELVFNAGLQYTSAAWLLDFVKRLIEAGAGGLVLSLHDGKNYSQEVLDYCNEKQFPLFAAGWNTPYIDIMRLFAAVLLKNEQRETNLNTALRNAIYYPENEAAYIHYFEYNGFYRNMEYIMAVLSCNAYWEEDGNKRLQEIARELHYLLEHEIIVEENGRLLIMVSEQGKEHLKKVLQKICASDSRVYVGIGTEVSGLRELQESYEHAMTAYQLTKTAIETNILAYEELGLYKILSDIRHPELGERFIEEVLDSLIRYDEQNGTDYMKILEAFFKHDCSILHTSKAIYCHKNTLNYKMNKVKEILGYDIMSNENRARIITALYFMKMRP